MLHKVPCHLKQQQRLQGHMSARASDSAESIYLLRQPSVMRQLLYASSPQHLQVAIEGLVFCSL